VVAGRLEQIVIRHVVCAANKYGDLIICGARHHDKIMNAQIIAIGKDKCKPTEGYQGFIDQFGVFMSREEALVTAKASGQKLNMARNSGNGKVLYSEGIY
jgi:hypothetical protein